MWEWRGRQADIRRGEFLIYKTSFIKPLVWSTAAKIWQGAQDKKNSCIKGQRFYWFFFFFSFSFLIFFSHNNIIFEPPMLIAQKVLLWDKHLLSTFLSLVGTHRLDSIFAYIHILSTALNRLSGGNCRLKSDVIAVKSWLVSGTICSGILVIL